MADSGKDDEPKLAEGLAKPPDAVVSGSVVGTVQGLIWSDISGIDVVSVAVQHAHVAVPIESDRWRGVDVVDLKVSPAMLTDAPRVQDLEASGGIRAVEIVANHFSMPLAGPPPGPSTGKLPPWWHKEKAHGLEQGDDPTLFIG
jgi:hypothetical protein